MSDRFVGNRATARRALRAGALAIGALALAGAACTGKPVITSPVDGSSVGNLPSGALPVAIQLPTLPPSAKVVVKLLAGADEAPSTLTDVTSLFTVSGGAASGSLPVDALGAGRNTLFVQLDNDGNGVSDATSSSTFRYEPVLRAAACAKKITPVDGVNIPGTPNHTHPVYMAGFDNDRQATGVHDDTWARGVVLESRGKKIAFVVIDAIGYFNNEIRTIRELVDDPSFDTIVVSSTHVHESADTMGLWGPSQTETGVDVGYLDFVNQQVADCVTEANAALAPAEIRFATGNTVGASLPPEPDLVADGEILQHLCVKGFFDTNGVCVGGTEVQGDEGPVRNPTTPSLQIRGKDSQAIVATLVNYASHPESLGSDNTLITSDFPHYMREALEARYGGIAIYMSADLGVLQGPLDVFLADPVNPALQVPRRTFEFARVMGDILADRAGDALDAQSSWLSGPKIAVAKTGSLQVQVENPYFKFLGVAGIFGRRDFVENGNSFTTLTELQAVRVGPAQFAVTPNELDPQIGNHYRGMMNAQHKFLTGLGNDEIGYQMPAAKFNPSCFLCFSFNVFGVDPGNKCPQATNDCGTVFVNNIGPGVDGYFQGFMTGLLGELNP